LESRLGLRSWKALDAVHPGAAGIEVGGSEPLGDRQPGPRPGAGAALRMFYGGSPRDGEVADRQRRTERGYAIDGRVLDAGLEQNGLEVHLVNARDTQNRPGPKIDVQECQRLCPNPIGTSHFYHRGAAKRLANSVGILEQS